MPIPSDPRTQRLIAARRAAAAHKQAVTVACVDEMVTEGDHVSFTSVHRAAGVSTWFVYNNPAVRRAIETAMQEQQAQSTSTISRPNTPVDDRTMRGLRTELANARSEIRDLRAERDRLRRRLQRDLGDQLDARSSQELAEELHRLNAENAGLRTELQTATVELATTKHDRDDAIADRDGAHLALRQMMRQVPSDNRSISSQATPGENETRSTDFPHGERD
ncbi:DUF6262 family protein [Tsukamurella pulmonis]|uniref:DUF6262 family protein n=1 Tax=Tsukamurella pulmonis TaxID=47312 RepID=UPI00105878D1|nr:DUF6262 family protein [Tsukamurella pulmonis]